MRICVLWVVCVVGCVGCVCCTRFVCIGICICWYVYVVCCVLWVVCVLCMYACVCADMREGERESASYGVCVSFVARTHVSSRRTLSGLNSRPPTSPLRLPGGASCCLLLLLSFVCCLLCCVLLLLLFVGYVVVVAVGCVFGLVVVVAVVYMCVCA